MLFSSSPSSMTINPFIRFSLARLAMMVRPKTASEKYSGAPKESATSARGSEKANRTTAPSMPPMLEATTEVVSARPGLPCRVSSWPSIMVAAAAGVPGVPMAIAVMEPPYSPARYTETSSSTLTTGSMPKVKGTISATAVDALSPGKTPQRIPISTPATMATRAGTLAMVENPRIRLSSIGQLPIKPAGRGISSTSTKTA